MYQYLPGATAVETICFDTSFETAGWGVGVGYTYYMGVMWVTE
jgi:hypothetical protein